MKKKLMDSASGALAALGIQLTVLGFAALILYWGVLWLHRLWKEDILGAIFASAGAIGVVLAITAFILLFHKVQKEKEAE